MSENITSATVAEPVTATEKFTRERTMHRFTAREIIVADVRELDAPFIRVTFTGPELHDFVSTGPADHAKLFFPHPITGEIIAPTAVGPTESGIVRPEAPMFPRDFTPLNVRDDAKTGMRAFDVDFLKHPDAGPASGWAESAKPGDRLVAAGPRGSVSAPQGADTLLCIVDASALPAAARFIAAVPATTTIEVVLDLAHADLDWAEQYLREQSGRHLDVMPVTGTLADAAADMGVGAGTFLFAAGEATRLIPLRRLLKYELQTPREQYALSGYWKRGTANFDHHAPIDPDDPEE